MIGADGKYYRQPKFTDCAISLAIGEKLVGWSAERQQKSIVEIAEEYNLSEEWLKGLRHYIAVDPGADEASDSINHGSSPSAGELYHESFDKWFPPGSKHRPILTTKPAGGWGDLPIGAVFAGGENGELLEVVEGSSCRKCYHRAGCYFTPNNLAPTCMRDNRNDGQYVCFVKLERTSDE